MREFPDVAEDGFYEAPSGREGTALGRERTALGREIGKLVRYLLLFQLLFLFEVDLSGRDLPQGGHYFPVRRLHHRP